MKYLLPQKLKWKKILTSIWQEVLKIDQVGVNDHFFALGGDSIKSDSSVRQTVSTRIRA